MVGKRIFYFLCVLRGDPSSFFLAVSAVSDVLSTNEINGFREQVTSFLPDLAHTRGEGMGWGVFLLMVIGLFFF